MLNYMDECQSCPDAIVAFNSVLALTINFCFDWSIFDARLFKGEIPAYARLQSFFVCYSGDRKSFRIVV